MRKSQTQELNSRTKKREEKLKRIIDELAKADEAKPRKFNSRMLTIILLLFFSSLMYYLPFLTTKKRTFEEYLALPYYRKIMGYNHPMMPDPCDTTSPFYWPR